MRIKNQFSSKSYFSKFSSECVNAKKILLHSKNIWLNQQNYGGFNYRTLLVYTDNKMFIVESTQLFGWFYHMFFWMQTNMCLILSNNFVDLNKTQKYFVVNKNCSTKIIVSLEQTSLVK